ncbi:hypothetical protein BD289DRAFT_485231 [Coniella lustricola]|uniref:Uncharacterized protein n=1 Tax=Coniella lustricola TaxID=2025994 RepID=A0A2T2ZZB6_9PEZI|nr:hypothetical protein BD289DRAFT_485231 [Coniella lustricola]
MTVEWLSSLQSPQTMVIKERQQASERVTYTASGNEKLPSCRLCLHIKSAVVKYVFDQRLTPPSIKSPAFKNHVQRLKPLCNLSPPGSESAKQDFRRVVDRCFRDLFAYTVRFWTLQHGLLRAARLPDGQLRYNWSSELAEHWSSSVATVEAWMKHLSKIDSASITTVSASQLALQMDDLKIRDDGPSASTKSPKKITWILYSYRVSESKPLERASSPTSSDVWAPTSAKTLVESTKTIEDPVTDR